LDEAIEDLEAEVSRGGSELICVLAFLWQSKGESARAREMYEQYLASGSADGELEALARSAIERLN
jgi:Tfp pilus assembly protein PilF